MTKQKVKTGKVLLAEPFMLDNNFKRAAVLVCDYAKDEGTVGFIINKPLDMRVDDLIVDFPEFDAEVFFGGPVQTDTIHYLHNVGELLDESTKIVDGLYWGGDFEKLKFLITQGLIEPKNIRFFVGYTGWSEGQLEEELKLGSWVISDMYANYLFKSPPDYLWQEIMEKIGDPYSVIAQMPDGVSWN